MRKDPDYPHYRLLQIVIRSKPSGKISSTLYDKWPKDILEQFYSREDLEEIMLRAEWPALRREAAVKVLKERNLPLELLYDIYCDPESERSEIRDIPKKSFENNDFNRDDLVHMAGDPEVFLPRVPGRLLEGRRQPAGEVQSRLLGEEQSCFFRMYHQRHH